MLHAREIRNIALKAGLLVLLAFISSTLLVSTADAQEANNAKVVVGTYDEELAFRKHPAYEELIKAYDAIQAAKKNNNSTAFQKAQKELEQKRQQVTERFRKDLEEGLPKVAAAAGVDVIAVQLVYRTENVSTKNITPLLVQTFTGESLQGAREEKGGDTEAEIGIYNPQKVFQNHPRYKELVTAMTAMHNAKTEGDQQAAMKAQQVFEQKRTEIVKEYQKDTSRALADTAKIAGVEAIALQISFTSDNIKTQDITPVLASVVAQSSKGNEDSSGLSGLR